MEPAVGVAEEQTPAGETMQAARERVLGAKVQLLRLEGETVVHVVGEERRTSAVLVAWDWA